MNYLNLFKSVIVVGLLAFSIGCGKSKSGGGPQAENRPMGGASVPGQLPDGSKVPPLTEEELVDAVMTFMGAFSVLSTVVDAMPEVSISGESAERDSVLYPLSVFKTDDDLKDDIKRNCQIKVMEPVEESEFSQDGNNFSGSFTMTGDGYVRGAHCPLESRSEIAGRGTIQGRVDNQGEVIDFNTNSTGSMSYSIVATDRLTQRTGFKSTGINLGLSERTFSRRRTGDNYDMEMFTDLSGRMHLDTVTWGELPIQVLSETDMIADERGGRIDSKSAFISSYNSKTLLLQIFVLATPEGGSMRVYINGESIDLEDSEMRLK